MSSDPRAQVPPATDIPVVPDIAVATAAGIIDRPPALAEAMGDVAPDEEGTSLWQGAFQRLRPQSVARSSGRSS